MWYVLDKVWGIGNLIAHKISKTSRTWINITFFTPYSRLLISGMHLCIYEVTFLGAKAPLGSLEQKLKVKVKVKPKKLRNSMILPKLLDDG